jgi:formylglycine-generating enzyme required for sulfatase activity
MPGTEVVRKQTVLGGAAGIALLAFALVYRFYPASENKQISTPPEPAPVASGPALTIKPPPAPGPVTATPAKPEPAPEPAEPTAPAIPPSKEIAALLKRASDALAKDNLIDPKDANALDLYKQVLAVDEKNAEALRAVEKIHKSLLQQANAALDKGDERDSSRLVAAFAGLPKPGDDLTKLQARLKTAHDVLPLLTRAAVMLKGGHATLPPDNNALAVYRQVQKLDPANKLADEGLSQIQQDYLDRALAAAAQDDFDGADKILAEASPIRPGSHELLDTRTRIEGIRRERATNTLAQASSALDSGNPDLAELLAKKALGLSPDLAGVDDFSRRLRNSRLYASFSPGQVITDKFLDRHGTAPPVVVIPTGTFLMGSPPSESGHRPAEEPQREVKIDAGFALARDEISVGEFRAFIDDAGYVTDAEKTGDSNIYDEDSGRMIDKNGASWRNDYLGAVADNNLPVIHVSWNDASAYAQWLSTRTGKKYRLPSEAEFEYALRAGSVARYPWGEGNPARNAENFTGDGDRSAHLNRSWAKAFRHYEDSYWGPAPIGKFRANAFGLIDMNGNVSEWVADCWHDNYTRAPADSRAWVNPGCAEHVVRGGSWGSAPDQVRSAFRLAAPTDTRSARVGMRVAREL